MERIMKSVLVILLPSLLFLSGCNLNPFKKKDTTLQPSPLNPIQQTLNVNTLWQVNTGGYAKKQYVKIHPAVDTTTVYVAGATAASAWNKQTGQLIWKTPVADIVTGGVNIGDGLVFLGTSGGNAIALEQKTGKPKWVQSLSSEVLAVSRANQNMVAFRTNDGKLHGLSTATGEVIWSQSRKTPILSLRGSSVPIIADHRVIAGFDNGKVVAFDMQAGHAEWEAILGVPRGRTELDRVVDVDGKMKRVGSHIYAATYHGQIASINLGNGSIAWSTSYSSNAGLDANAGFIFTADEQGQIFKITTQNGKPIWRMDDLLFRQPTAPTLVGNHIVVGDYAGYLHWINNETGLFAARTRGDQQGYTVSPVVDGNTIYTLGKSGILSAIAIQ